MTLSCRLAGYASTCDARALDASPVFLRALAECLRQAATSAEVLERSVLAPGAMAANVVPLHRRPAARGGGGDAA